MGPGTRPTAQPWCVHGRSGKAATRAVSSQPRVCRVADAQKERPHQISVPQRPLASHFRFRRCPDRRTGRAQDAMARESPHQALSLRNLQQGRSQVPFPAGGLGQPVPPHEPLIPANANDGCACLSGTSRGEPVAARWPPASSSQTALGPSSWEGAARSPRGPAGGARHSPGAARGKGKSKPNNSVGHARLSE